MDLVESIKEIIASIGEWLKAQFSESESDVIQRFVELIQKIIDTQAGEIN
jgi:hypothetical protein